MTRKDRLCEGISRNNVQQSASPGCPAVSVDPVTSRCKLNGNLARRKLVFDGVVWDERLTGFSLRVRKTGYKAWIVKLSERGRPRVVTLGPVSEMNARTARARARALLEHAILDGLPTRQAVGQGKAVPLFREFAPEFWANYAHHWKPSTQ